MKDFRKIREQALRHTSSNDVISEGDIVMSARTGDKEQFITGVNYAIVVTEDGRMLERGKDIRAINRP